MEWSLEVEPWSGVLEWILEWNEVKFGVIVVLLGQDLVQIDLFLVIDIACKFESHTVCICRQSFRTDFSWKINFKSNFRESVDFQKGTV